MIDWTKESPLIEAEATKRNLDPCFLKAIREQENGRVGANDCEFGVVSARGEGYQTQLTECAATVAHRLESFPGNPLHRNLTNGRIQYTSNWIAYFQSIWAPIGVDNDPTNLNKNWLSGVLRFYTKWIGAKID